MKKHIVFDFDGTLVDTNGIIVNSWQAVYMKYRGKPGDLEEIYNTFGETLWDSLEAIFPDVDTDEAIAVYRNYQEQNYHGKVTMFEGVKELVTAVREMGCTTSIVTARTRRGTEAYLDEFGIRELFDVVITCDDLAACKPDPAPLLMALDKLGASAEEAIMLGDSSYDIGCANNAGVDSVFVEWSLACDVSDVLAAGYQPTFVISEPQELLNFIISVRKTHYL